MLSPWTVHPRACGEQCALAAAATFAAGSSPRVRGTGQRIGAHCRPDRFIPARAGNRCSNPRRRQSRPVHPRACGEQTTRRKPTCARRGSSPRVRGTAMSDPIKGQSNRFIPARAGNRPEPQTWHSAHPVHPRACGEQLIAASPSFTARGSSPRVRGTAWRTMRRVASIRFIPARAGNSRHGSRLSKPRPVHPRACGEQRHTAPMTKPENGSSPRVRGTERLIGAGWGPVRFIPARAGNSNPPASASLCAPVHPRACGEQGHLAHGVDAPPGSSPRVRGTGWRYTQARL